nr:MAG TPA: hypothetical protein [Caudoviricetes sp.]
MNHYNYQSYEVRFYSSHMFSKKKNIIILLFRERKEKHRI